MSHLVITHGAGPNRSVILAAAVVRLETPRAFTFSYGGYTVTISALLEVPPRGPNGNYLMPLPEGALLPGSDAVHQVGDASVYVQLTPLARSPKHCGPDAFLFAYEVSERVAAPIAVAA